MSLDVLADIGIPCLVALLSYLCIRWSQADQTNREALQLDEPLINQL